MLSTVGRLSHHSLHYKCNNDDGITYFCGLPLGFPVTNRLYFFKIAPAVWRTWDLLLSHLFYVQSITLDRSATAPPLKVNTILLEAEDEGNVSGDGREPAAEVATAQDGVEAESEVKEDKEVADDPQPENQTGSEPTEPEPEMTASEETELPPESEVSTPEVTQPLQPPPPGKGTRRSWISKFDIWSKKPEKKDPAKKADDDDDGPAEVSDLLRQH